jgi:NitT/TauT family transport system substrate-binding protein
MNDSRCGFRMSARSILIGLGIISISFFAGGSVYAQTKIVEGYVSEGALQWPEYVAKDKGWFKENKITLEMIPVGGGAAQQLAAGALNIGYSGFPDFIRATNQGAPIKIFINGVNTPPYGVFAKPKIKKVADLKGKVVSVGGNKDVTLIYVGAMLASAGLKPNDVDYIYAKATPDRLAALISGGVDAAILYPPATFKAAAQGFTNLGDIGHFLKDFPFTVWAVNTDWAKGHGDALRGYIRAYSRAVAWLYDRKNKDDAVALLVKYSKVSPKDAAETYDYFTRINAYSKDGRISKSGYQKMTNALLKFGDLHKPVPRMSKFVDESFVKAAWKNWF